MVISGSAFSAGVAGVQRSMQDMQATARRISDASAGNGDPVADMVKLNAERQQAEANTKVMKTADETLGTLIDTSA